MPLPIPIIVAMLLLFSPFIMKAEKKGGSTHIQGGSHIQGNGILKSNAYYLHGAEHLSLANNYFDIPVAYNPAVAKWINYFTKNGRDYFIRYAERAGRYAPILGKILEEQGLPRDLVFLAMAESGFHNQALSTARAVGPWQFIYSTGKNFGLNINWYVDERRDPIKSTIAAGRYLKKLYRDFGSWELAMVAYNAGEGKIAEAVRRYKSRNLWILGEGRYLKAETKNYFPKISALAIVGKNLKSFGLNDVQFENILDFDELSTSPMTDLIALSEAIGIPFSEIRRFNPELLRWMTPPDIAEYPLRLPKGYKQKYHQCCTKRGFRASHFQKHIVTKKTTVKQIASMFRLDVTVLAYLNGVNANYSFKRGSEVSLPFRLGQDHHDEMYSDLYMERKASKGKKSRLSGRTRLSMQFFDEEIVPSSYHVQKGDSLLIVSQKTGVPLDKIIKSNYHLLSKRMIREGDELALQ